MTVAVYHQRLFEAHIQLEEDEIVEILSIPDLPAGQYVISGHVSASNHESDTASQVVAKVHVGEVLYCSALVRLEAPVLGAGPSSATLPLNAYAELDDGPVGLRVSCQRHGQIGSPAIKGGSGLSLVIATRVGDPTS